MKTVYGNTLIVIAGGWLLLGCASEVQRAPDDSPSTSSVAPGTAPGAFSVAGFEAAFSQEGSARLSEQSQSEEFQGALDRGDLEGFCHSFGKLMDAIYREPWRLAEVNPTAPHRGCAVISRPPDISFMCCPCKYPGPVHKICRTPVK